MATWMIEGEWTGPANPAGDYTRIAHRHYTKRAKEAQACADLGHITHTDGTGLILSVQDVTRVHHTKRKPARDSYRKLINDCIRHGVSSVAALP